MNEEVETQPRQQEVPERHGVHYETIPHDKNCPLPQYCDCDCHGCVHARGGKIVNRANRIWFIETYGLPTRYLCAKDNYRIPEAY